MVRRVSRVYHALINTTLIYIIIQLRFGTVSTVLNTNNNTKKFNNSNNNNTRILLFNNNKESK